MRNRENRPVRLVLVLVIISGFLNNLVVQAQVESGKIVGTARDASGAVLAEKCRDRKSVV